MLHEFAVNDRVIIKPELSNGFNQPYRKWAEQGRKATIIAIDTGWKNHEIRVQFDSVRNPKRPTDYMLNLEPKELRKIPL